MQAFKFCPSCGESALQQHCSKSVQCTACQFMLYMNSVSAVAAIMTCENHVLLTVRGRDPHVGKLDLPGGFVDYGETAEQALARELREELDFVITDAPYFCSFPNIYPYNGIVYHTVDLFYRIQLEQRPVLKADDDVASLTWVDLGDLPWENIAFPSIRQALFKVSQTEGTGGAPV